MNITKLVVTLLVIGSFTVFMSCGGGQKSAPDSTQSTGSGSDTYKPAATASTKDLGIGPVKHVDLGPIDANQAAIGKELFEAKCTSCHKWQKEKYVGPGLMGVTKRREPEWIMNQMLNPNEMTANDSIAKGLLAVYLTQMTNQNLTVDQARNILEYFRQQDAVSN